MEQIIERLIEARHAAELSLEDIHKKTKIPLRQLEYLESYQFDQIGPSVYLKGFIRRYAQEVGIDPSTLWEQEGAHTPVVSTPRQGRKPIRFNITPFLKICAVLLLLALVGFLIRAAIQNFFEPSPPPPPDVPPQDQPDPENGQDEEEEPPEEEPEPEPEVIVDLEDESDSGVAYVVRNADSLDITLSFTGNCWLRAFADGEKELEGTFGRNHQEELSAAEDIQIRFGAPKFVSVTINGIEIEMPDIQRGYNLDIRLEEETE